MQVQQAIGNVGKNGRVKSLQDKFVDLLVVVMSVIAILICLLPMLNVAATSLSSELAIINRRVFIWPVELDFEAYKGVFQDKSMMRSLILTATLTVVSTIFSMIMTIMCAYPLSQKKLVGRGLFNTIVILTMYFNAGIIPDYLNIKRLDLLDNFWALVLPIGISVFNMIILKSFFLGLPDSLQESAELDGASHWTVLARIFLPLSMPALATIALFYAVGRWNGFQDARIYISSPDLYPIQFKLYQIISNLSSVEASMEGVSGPKVAAESMKAASIMFATLPILMIYPWLQRYFVAGVTLGAVKG